MNHVVAMERYPVFILTIQKSDCLFATLDDIVEYYRQKIEQHPIARLIGIFDHYAHTRDLAEGVIMPEIVGAKNVIFCFGMAIPQPEILALRPRSIGIADLADRFVISFLETPMPIANTAMEEWTKGLRQTPAPTAYLSGTICTG